MNIWGLKRRLKEARKGRLYLQNELHGRMISQQRVLFLKKQLNDLENKMRGYKHDIAQIRLKRGKKKR